MNHVDIYVFFSFPFLKRLSDAESVTYPFRLRVAILPMLLHLHQRQLDFLIDFFQAKSGSIEKSAACHKDSCDSSLLATKRRNLAGQTIVDEALLPYFQASGVELICFTCHNLFQVFCSFIGL